MCNQVAQTESCLSPLPQPTRSATEQSHVICAIMLAQIRALRRIRRLFRCQFADCWAFFHRQPYSLFIRSMSSSFFGSARGRMHSAASLSRVSQEVLRHAADNLSLSSRSPFFTQDFAISLNPSPSGSLRTAQGVSKYMVARCSEVYAGQCGRPS